MSLLTMMITLEKAIQKSMTRSFLSVHHTSFLWACQEFVLSTTHLKPTVSGVLLPFWEITPTKALSSRSRRVTFES